MGNKNASGAWGEEAAVRFLQSEGYRIAERNYRLRCGEIDIIAEKDGILAFVEVKTRKSAAYGSPSEYVGAEKQRKIRMTAELYLCSHPSKLQPRFDVLEIYAPLGAETKDPAMNHIIDAFW